MLHIIWMILKIVGIVLLVILGLVFLVLLLVLLVPVRYRLAGSYHEKPAGGADVSWFFKAVFLSVTYEDGLRIALKLLGRKVFQLNGDDAEDGEEEWTDDAEDVLRDAADLPAEPDAQKDTSPADGAKPAEAGTDRPGQEQDRPEDRKTAGKGTCSEGPDAGAEMQAMELNRTDGEGTGSECPDAGAEMQVMELNRTDGDREPDRQTADEGPEHTGEELFTAPEQPEDDSSEPRTDIREEDLAETDEPASSDAEQGIGEKIEALFSKIGDKLEWAEEKRRWAARFIRDSRNQRVFALLWRQVKALLRHLLPRKAKGQLTLGFEDPAVTGQALAICGVFYGLYGGDVSITPDFEHPVIDGDLEIKGRVYAGAAAVLAARVLIDRNFWRMIKQVRRFLAKGGN